MIWDPYEIMGVGKDFTETELKIRYRLLSKELHPDKNPDDPEAEENFKDMKEAYEILKDPDRKGRFDTNGDRSDRKPEDVFETKFRGLVSAVFMQIVENAEEPEKMDLLQPFKDALRESISAVDKGVRVANQRIAKFERVHKRVFFKGDGDNILAQSIQSTIDGLERQVENSKTELEFLCKAKDLVDLYGYDWDRMKELDLGGAGIGLGVRNVYFDPKDQTFEFRDE